MLLLFIVITFQYNEPKMCELTVRFERITEPRHIPSNSLCHSNLLKNASVTRIGSKNNFN